MNGLFRIKCPQCGNVLDINGPTPCPGCGTQLAPFGASLKVYRMGSPIGVAAGYGVYINNQPWGHIANKETVTYTLPYGTYNIHMTCGMTRKCQDLSVTLTPEAPAGFVKAHIKPGFWTNCIVIEPSNPAEMPE